MRTRFFIGTILTSCAVILSSGTAALAQQFPVPHLATVTPPGGQAGTSVEVAVDGKYLDEAISLIFSNAAIKAERLPEPPPKDPKKPQPAGPARFKVLIPGPLHGSFDARVVGKWGVSNPRVFVVSSQQEIAEKEPNNDVPQAQAVTLGDVVNGVINPKVDVDFYQFHGKKGTRVLIHCAGSSIDSRLNPALELYSMSGQLLATNRQYRQRDALLDCRLPADGDYFVRVFEFTYVNGGPEYFYRLSLNTGAWLDAAYPPVVEAGKNNAITLFGRNLPSGKAGPMSSSSRHALEATAVNIMPPAVSPSNFLGTKLPRSGSVDGFEYRLKDMAGASNPILLTYADAPVVLDNERNDSMEEAQEITLPCCLCGRIEKRGDRDWYKFSAKMNDTFAIEGFADRIGSPIDLYFVLRRMDNGQRIGEYDDSTEIPATVGSVFTLTSDPLTRFVAPADGDYQLLVCSRTADVLGGPRSIYRVSIRREQPDFRLLVVGNNDQHTGGCTVRRGLSQDLEVICFRRDGFDGEVELTCEGLPAGVTCTPQTIGPKARSTNLVVSAADNAKDSAGEIRIKGTAVIDSQKVIREARAGCLVWPPPNNAPAISRLAQSLYLAVRDRDQFPFALDVKEKEILVPVGGSGAVNVQLKKFASDLAGNIQVQRLSGPVLSTGAALNFPNTNIAVTKPQAEIKFTVPTNAQPGTYNLVFKGQGTFKYKPDPKVNKTQNMQVTALAPPVNVTVYNKVAEVTLGAPTIAIKAGGQAELLVRVQRLHGYKGDFKVQVVLPGSTGVSVADITIPANASEGKLVLKANKDAKPNTSPNVIIRATARVGTSTLVHEVKTTLTVSALTARAATMLSTPAASVHFFQLQQS